MTIRLPPLTVTVSPAPGMPAVIPSVAPEHPTAAVPQVVRAFQFPVAIAVQAAAKSGAGAIKTVATKNRMHARRIVFMSTLA